MPVPPSKHLTNRSPVLPLAQQNLIGGAKQYAQIVTLDLNTKLFSCCINYTFKSITISSFPFFTHASHLTKLGTGFQLPFITVPGFNHFLFLHFLGTSVPLFYVYIILHKNQFVKGFSRLFLFILFFYDSINSFARYCYVQRVICHSTAFHLRFIQQHEFIQIYSKYLSEFFHVRCG